MNLRSVLQAQQPEGKAIPDHPALHRPEPVEFYVPGGGSTRTEKRLTQNEAPRHLQAYGGKEAIDWVRACVSFYADNAMSAEWFFKQDEQRLYKKRTDTTPSEAKIAPFGLYELMEEPNPYMDYEEMMQLIIIDLLLVGNSYWVKWMPDAGGKPLALYRMAPPYVSVTPGAQGVVDYRYKPSGVRDEAKFDPARVIHFKLPNPHNPYYGLGVIQGGGRPLDLELALTEHQTSYFEKGTMPSMIVQSDRRVSKDVWRKLFAQLRAKYSGSRNTGELMLLESGLKASTLTPTAANAQFAELTRLSRDRVLSMFRMPPKLLGISDEGTGTDKIADARRIFDQMAMKPLTTLIANKLTRDLARAWDAEFIIDYRYIMPLEDQIKLAGDYAAIPGVTVRETREFLGLPPTGDKEIDDLVLNLPAENGTQGNTRNGAPNRNLPGQPGRPPNGENVPAIGQINSGGSSARRPSEGSGKARLPQGKALTFEEVEARIRELEAEGKAITFEDPARATIGSKLPNEKRPSDALASRRGSEIDSLANDLAEDFRGALHVLERGLLDNVEGKAFKPNDLVKRMKNSEAWKSFTSLAGDAMEKMARRAISTAVVHQGRNGLTPDEEFDYESMAREIVYRKGGIRDITKTFREALVKEVVEELAKKDTTKADIDNLVQSKIRQWKDGKAETVALTEAVVAYNEGTVAVAEAMGIDQLLVTDGTDDDEPCITADGQVWDVATARDNLLEHPRCRRAFIPLPEAT